MNTSLYINNNDTACGICGGQYGLILDRPDTQGHVNPDLDFDHTVKETGPGEDQTHIRVFQDFEGGHVRSDGRPGFTCGACGLGYATARALNPSSHDCEDALEG